MTPNTVATRRDFLTTSALAGSAAALSTGGLFAGASDTIKVGLVGCGGRGTGAAKNALKADPNVKLVAMADAFGDNIKSSLSQLTKNEDIAKKIDVKPEMMFTGFDAYKKVIEASDVVLLCTPPHFRPMHLRATVEAGKNAFAEKPLAVDAAGVRSVIESAKIAAAKKLSILCGYCYRWDFAKRETVKRIHDGVIGDISAIHVNYITGTLWHRPTTATFDTMEYQMRNWYYFTWLSGDFNVEQHCHNHDKASWVLKGEMPIAAYGQGGRQMRTDPKFGNIYDHHGVVYEYKSGVKVFSFCRQMSGVTRMFNDVSDHVIGTKGSAQLMAHTIKTGDKVWGYEGPNSDMYDQEHIEFFEGIRKGTPINNLDQSWKSTLMSIMGRMATYTGMKITWEMALNSKEDLSPPSYTWEGKLPYAPVAVPGVTKFV
ncbi:Gfo/Idh/MocA family protein [Zavarzinella formosa]|uniref:Gfo/Idh/MocA family protein n=1 Tax=Zavarzinella formosa TaxID=360055 RepID=UPI0002E6BFA1|nr:Gfo/Idh/MocA family oxidoreductase [Zavarzinella formosa]